jgi:valyl-tRNA synthetase
MLGDTAVMVHPDDERYRHLIGKMVRLPLTERTIPIIADAYVDLEFGTGCVKVTPAHDFNDYAVGQRHRLPMIPILTLDAKINDNAPELPGMDRFERARQIVADLEAAGLLDKVDAHKLMVPRGDRTGVVIEPMLTDQWFVAMSKPGADGKSIAGKALDVRGLRRDPVLPRELGQHLQPVAEQHPGLVHLAPALVGPPDSGLVWRRGRRSLSLMTKPKPGTRPRHKATHGR